MTRRLDPLDLDAVVKVDKIPPSGRVIIINSDDEQKKALADRLKVDVVEDFAAKVTVTRFRGGLRAEGRVSGTIVQACVVTGDPVTQSIDEAVDRVYLPGHDEASEASAGAEVFVNLEDDDLPDYFDGNEIDLADLVLEVFALSIDLYPRKPGVELDEATAGDDPAALSPFAALKSLKAD
ncbi:YceD family protein [Pelagibacterium luteolum]|uniref:Uncharacterized metal-binding protein YceD, DUF177 family n=1 Tax=Pelagibacterium luteolum TaxID=440168 RepID=A0A1G7WFE2_9HYPH|nr:DUF177 domain-containing protein [Pelagibacterium luteolum]SDG70737.1 Uncharacterized metal-binding protein YceD, DUF177 family [Pelagibacterium luteolum]